MIPATAGVTQALVDLLAGVTSRTIGDGRRPVKADPPFAVVELITGGDTWGPAFTAPQAAAGLDYQVASVAIERAEAEGFADTVRDAIVGRAGDGSFLNPLTVAGLVVLERELLSYGGLIHDNGAFSVTDQYRIHVTL